MQYIQEIKQILSQARQKSYAAINSAMVEAYWKIGEKIVLEEQNGKDRAKYGERILKEVSQAMTAELGKGFSYANIYNMRQFYLTYPDFEKFYTLCSKLSWSHNRLIMRISDEKARNYYLAESLAQNWSVRVLDRNIQSFMYNRILTSTSEIETREVNSTNNDFVKDPYVFEFLNIEASKKTSESELESLLIENLQSFILELGKGFSFVARQMRISTETDHFYIDLVFYNYILKCFVIFDLKTTKLTHQDIGQLDMYVRMFDDLKKGETDNPTIGILLCAEKNETMVKYSVLNDNNNLFASKYYTFLPSEQELIEEIEREKTIFTLEQGKKK